MTIYITHYHWISAFLFIPSFIVAHTLSPDSYNWRQHTISDLASQQYDYRWIMKLGLILSSFVLATGIMAKSYVLNQFPLDEVFLLIYSLSVLVSGLYSTSPFVHGIPFSRKESSIHSIAVGLATVSFFPVLFFSALKEVIWCMKLAHIATLGIAVISASVFLLFPFRPGVIQRFMHLAIILWIIFFYNQS